MRKKLHMLNIAVLLFGNVLFETIHYFESHDHSISYEIHDCQECLVLENNSNYTSDFYNVNSLKNKFTFLTSESFGFIRFNLKSKNRQRAPPFS